MNNFFAMLKDSFREAIDGWIFPVMLGLAALVILLVGTLSAKPVVSDRAVERMIDVDGQLLLSPDRGQAKKFAFYFLSVAVSDTKVENVERPWEGAVQFELTFKTQGFGAAGAEVDLDENKKPKIDQEKIKDALVMGDAFKEAVRYWASKPGEKKPAFTEELAVEFVTDLVQKSTRLKVTEVTPVKPPKKGLLDNFTGTPTKYLIKASSGEKLGWAHTPVLFFGLVEPGGALPLGNMIQFVESTMINSIGGWIILLAGVIVTAGFIPNMLRKGAIDLLLIRPMSRPAILLYKYFGGLLFVFLLTLFSVAGVWLVVGLRSGIWTTGFLWSVAGLTAYFAILYACSTMIAVLTRNTIVAIIGTILFWAAVWLIGTINSGIQFFDSVQAMPQPPKQQRTKKEERPKSTAPTQQAATEKKENANPEPALVDAEDAEPNRAIPSWIVKGVNLLNRATPRTGDLDTLTGMLITKDLARPRDLQREQTFTKDINWVEVGIVASCWLGLFLGIALLRFVTRSY